MPKHVIKIYNNGIDIDRLKQLADEFNVDPIGIVQYKSNDKSGVFSIWMGIDHFVLEFKNQEDAMYFRLKYQGPAEYYIEP